MIAVLGCSAAAVTPTLAHADPLVVHDLDHGVNAAGLGNALVGAGVTISNATYVGANRAAGTFAGGTGILGFDSGIVLDSGKVQTLPSDLACNAGVEGPNTCADNSTSFGLPGDGALTALSGFPTFDASVLEFDFVPAASTVQFRYVFTSEEYNEFANTTFNDVFGFFVNGTNCALVPGTTEPVSVNAINNGNPGGDATPHHPDLFIDNVRPTPTLNTQMDGLTVVLTCTASVKPGVANHMKLAIADASDGAFDSAVFIQASSLVSSDITLTPATATNPVGTSHTVTATVSKAGTAVSGVAVSFAVDSGPNLGRTGSAVTNASGKASFTYSDTGGAGTDTISASFVDATGKTQKATATKIWESGTHTTKSAYTGPGSGDFNDPVTVSGSLTDTQGSPVPVSGKTLTFKLNGAESCTAVTNASGSASCSLTPREAAGAYTVQVSFAGDAGFLASSASAPFTVTKEETTLAVDGPPQVANGQPATLTGTLKEDGTSPIAGAAVSFTLGSGVDAQSCTGTTGAGGQASCVIASVNQPATATTVPITAVFAGNAFYVPASAASTAKLLYYTGRAYDASLTLNALFLHVGPVTLNDTGPIQTSQPSSVQHTSATLSLGLVDLSLLSAGNSVVTGNGSSTSSATIATVHAALPLLPLITADTVKATSTSTCRGATGTTSIASLKIGGVTVVGPGGRVSAVIAPNSTVSIAGLTVILNEQAPVPGADRGLTVNAVHVKGLAGGLDLIIASAKSDIHNCG